MPGCSSADGGGERLLFVYGTLRRRSPHPMARRLRREASFKGQARCRGQLIDLGRYPGLIPGRGWVRGELFALPAGSRLLERLDEYEGCNAEPPEYRRQLIQLRRPGGRPASAFGYLYAQRPPSRRTLRGGVFTARPPVQPSCPGLTKIFCAGVVRK